MSKNYQPKGFNSVNAYLILSNAAEAIRFYEKALQAKQLLRLDGPGGKVMHAELQIGDTRIMLADEFPEMGALSPKTIGGTSVSFAVYVENVDLAFSQAIKAGGRELSPVKNQFYGDRSGTFEDPFGHKWSLATHQEDLSEAELKTRMAKMFSQG